MAQPDWLRRGEYPEACMVILRRRGREYDVERTCCGKRQRLLHWNLRRTLSEARRRIAIGGVPQTCVDCAQPRRADALRKRHEMLAPAGAKLQEGILPAGTAWAPTRSGLGVPHGWMPR